MNIEALENDVVAKLREEIPGAQVEAFPEDPAKFSPATDRGTILVSYAGSRHVPLSEGRTLYRRRPIIDIVIVRRGLRKQGAHQGAYDLIEQVIGALMGFYTQDVQLYPVHDEFIEEKDRDWQYLIRFETL